MTISELIPGLETSEAEAGVLFRQPRSGVGYDWLMSVGQGAGHVRPVERYHGRVGVPRQVRWRSPTSSRRSVLRVRLQIRRYRKVGPGNGRYHGVTDASEVEVVWMTTGR